MMMFIIGFIVAWILFSIFFCVRDNAGGWNIWGYKWDSVLIMLPILPIIFLIKLIEEKMNKT